MPYLSYAKDFAGVADVFTNDPSLYLPLLQFINPVMTRESALTIADREMIALHVSKLNDCHFCIGAHRATLSALGIDEKTIDAAEADPETDSIDEKFRAILRFAQELTLSPGSIAQDDIDALTALGWSEQAVEDAINVTALFNYVNRLVDGFGIEGTDDYFAHVGKALASQGYAPLIKAASAKAA